MLLYNALTISSISSELEMEIPHSLFFFQSLLSKICRCNYCTSINITPFTDVNFPMQ